MPNSQTDWEKRLQQDSYDRIINFIITSSAGEKQVFIDELAKLMAQELSHQATEILKMLDDEVDGLVGFERDRIWYYNARQVAAGLVAIEKKLGVKAFLKLKEKYS